MQLFELILIALTSFAIIILATLLISYFGYKTRKKIVRKNDLTMDVKLNDNNQNVKEDESRNPSEKKSENAPKQEKFVVFNPGLTKTINETSKEIKRHTPHKLFIKK